MLINMFIFLTYQKYIREIESAIKESYPGSII